MDPIQSPDHPRTHGAQQAPRCQHIKVNGQRCAAPALRGESHCHFHKRIESPATYMEPYLPFIEDATSLQLALARIMRMLVLDHVEYKRCALLLYSLQIACANLKAFMAEQPKPEVAECEKVQKIEPKRAGAEKAKASDEPGSLAELLLGFLAKPEGDPGAPPPRIRSREDYYAAMEQRERAAALPGETSAP